MHNSKLSLSRKIVVTAAAKSKWGLQAYSSRPASQSCANCTVRESLPRANNFLIQERQTVAIAILQDKRVKLQAIVEGSREIPHKLNTTYPDLVRLTSSLQRWDRSRDHANSKIRVNVGMLMEDLSGKLSLMPLKTWRTCWKAAEGTYLTKLS